MEETFQANVDLFLIISTKPLSINTSRIPFIFYRAQSFHIIISVCWYSALTTGSWKSVRKSLEVIMVVTVVLMSFESQTLTDFWCLLQYLYLTMSVCLSVLSYDGRIMSLVLAKKIIQFSNAFKSNVPTGYTCSCFCFSLFFQLYILH